MIQTELLNTSTILQGQVDALRGVQERVNALVDLKKRELKRFQGDSSSYDVEAESHTKQVVATRREYIQVAGKLTVHHEKYSNHQQPDDNPEKELERIKYTSYFALTQHRHNEHVLAIAAAQAFHNSYTSHLLPDLAQFVIDREREMVPQIREAMTGFLDAIDLSCSESYVNQMNNMREQVNVLSSKTEYNNMIHHMSTFQPDAMPIFTPHPFPESEDIPGTDGFNIVLTALTQPRLKSSGESLKTQRDGIEENIARKKQEVEQMKQQDSDTVLALVSGVDREIQLLEARLECLYAQESFVRPALNCNASRPGEGANCSSSDQGVSASDDLPPGLPRDAPRPSVQLLRRLTDNTPLKRDEIGLYMEVRQRLGTNMMRKLLHALPIKSSARSNPDSGYVVVGAPITNESDPPLPEQPTRSGKGGGGNGATALVPPPPSAPRPKISTNTTTATSSALATAPANSNNQIRALPPIPTDAPTTAAATKSTIPLTRTILLEDQNWYFGAVERTEVDALLTIVGDFIVRSSKGSYVLSARGADHVLHFKLAVVS